MSDARDTVYLDTCDCTTLSVSDSAKGIFGGYAAVWGEVPYTHGPKGGTHLERGAFKKTLAERTKPYQVLWNHHDDMPIGRTISIEEDTKGLRFQARVNLDIQLGRDVFSNIKNGVVDEMSIGFNITDPQMRGDALHIRSVRLQEISAVTFAANPNATITEAFSARPFSDFPISYNIKWNPSDARERVGSNASAFLWSNGTECRYQICDLDKDGELRVIPEAVYDVGAEIALNEIDLPENEVVRIKAHLARYYSAMGETPPWATGQLAAITRALLGTPENGPSVKDTRVVIVQEPQLSLQARASLERLRRYTNDTKVRLSNYGQRNSTGDNSA